MGNTFSEDEKEICNKNKDKTNDNHHFFVCFKSNQSPINIPKLKSLFFLFEEPIINYKITKTKAINNSHTISYNYEKGSYIKYASKKYNLKEFHFHIPGDHIIESNRSHMEIHLIHQTKDGFYLILAIPMNIVCSLCESSSINIFTKLFEDLPNKGKSSNQEHLINMIDVMPYDKSYYSYNSSNKIKWIIFINPIKISIASFFNFKNKFEHNNRKIKYLKGRKIGLFCDAKKIDEIYKIKN